MAYGQTLSIDVETCSEADLKKTGTSRYSKDSSTFVTVFAYAFDHGPIRSEVATYPGGISLQTLPHEVLDHIEEGGTIAAWNAWFEFCILKNTLHIPVSAEQMICTMQQALYGGLPASLGAAGLALKLPMSHLKDATAHKLMLQCSKPRSIDDKGNCSYWTDNTGTLMQLRAYCEQDVKAERSIAMHLPCLPDMEQQISILDRQTNFRGIGIDIPLVLNMLRIAGAETTVLNHKASILTEGMVTSPGTQSKRILDWMKTRGVDLADTRKLTIMETLDTAPDAELPQDVVTLLAIRRMVARSSLAKLKAMLNAVEDDDRIRGTLQYYGASRTGRFAGRIIQPQNFPRPSGDPETAIQGILQGLDHDGLRLFHGDPLNVLASCLRGTLVPTPGKVFISFDLSQIEARVIAWLCGQLDMLMVFERGDDVYQYTADQIRLPTRQAGKATVLGLGFGQGYRRFVAFAASYGVVLSVEESRDIVYNWRNANPRIVSGWWDLGIAVTKVIEQWHQTRAGDFHQHVFNNTVVVRVSTDPANNDPLLRILLPSGRSLFYRNPRIELLPVNVEDKDELGKVILNDKGEARTHIEYKPGIVFDGIDQTTKQWGSVRTWGSKLVENLVQAIARDVIIEAAVRIDASTPAALVFSVHDELVFEVDKDDVEHVYRDVEREVTRVPDWAPGLPVAASGTILNSRYGKG